MVPELDLSPDARFPIVGGLLQRRGGTVRHDAVAWGYARAADGYGVDIVQNCEVIGFLKDEAGRIVGVETTRGPIRAGKVGVAVAGSSSVVLAKAGLERLPIESHVLQAFVSESIKPLIDTVVTFGAGHLYISQSDKGSLVFGGDIDGYNTYAQRGNLPIVEEVAASAMVLFPNLGRLRVLRQWGGLLDMSMDGSPIICKAPIDGLYINAGWCYGGFKATPAVGLLLRPHHRPRRAAPAQRRLPARPVRRRRGDRREGRRPLPQGPLTGKAERTAACASPAPTAVPATSPSSPTARTATSSAPTRKPATNGRGPITSTSAPIRAARTTSSGITPPAAGNGCGSPATPPAMPF